MVAIPSESHLVVAFAGKIGSGKTTLTTALAEFLKWPRASFGDYVRTAVRERGLPQTRYNLQRVGTELLHNDIGKFCKSVLLSSGWNGNQSLIIDGLRHTETIDVIREIVLPATLKIVFISISDNTRLQRLKNRGEGNADAIEDADRHSSEQQVASVLRGCADLLVDGCKPR